MANADFSQKQNSTPGGFDAGSYREQKQPEQAVPLTPLQQKLAGLEAKLPATLSTRAAALALSGEPDAVSGALALSLGIGLQNIPEGAAVSLPLAHSGRTRLQAFGAGAASGLVEPLGALAAFALAGWVQAALPWLMSAAAGCMVCVTAQEMIPEAVEQDEPAGVVSIVLGFALMMALDVAL